MGNVVTNPSTEPVYLGDGVYASYDGWQVRLGTDQSLQVQEIYLEPAVLAAFFHYIETLKGGPIGT